MLQICNRTSFIVGLFSLSADNHLGTGGTTSHPKPVKEAAGTCHSVTVHNPTDSPFTVRIYNETRPISRRVPSISSTTRAHCLGTASRALDSGRSNGVKRAS